MPQLLSVRERILDAIEASFNAVIAPVDPDDIQESEYPFAWSAVRRGRLKESDDKEDRAIGIVELNSSGTTRIAAPVGFRISILRVSLEFKGLIETAEKASTEYNRILTAIERRVREDPTWGGLAQNTEVVSDTADFVDEDDKQVGGEVSIDLSFRYRLNDPRKQG